VKPGSESHEARKALFQLGIRRGHLTLDEIDRALPPGSLSPSERWLLFYSLRASGVDIRDRGGDEVERHPPGDPSPGP
jgi:sigma-70-like protein